MSLPRCAKHARIKGRIASDALKQAETSFKSLLLKNWERAFLRFFETQNDDVMVVGVALPKLVDDT